MAPYTVCFLVLDVLSLVQGEEEVVVVDRTTSPMKDRTIRG